jgi:hypothetical protein
MTWLKRVTVGVVVVVLAPVVVGAGALRFLTGGGNPFDAHDDDQIEPWRTLTP